LSIKHFATPEFWRCYADLPADIQELADKCFALLDSDPNHPSLKFKKVGNIHAARVGLHFRALAFSVNDGYSWFWIGRHDEYERIIESS